MIETLLLPEAVLQGTLFLATLGVALATVEDLYYRDIFSQDGLLSWDVLRVRSRPKLFRPFWSLMDRLYEPRVFEWILKLRLAAALLLLAGLAGAPGVRDLQFPLVVFILVSLFLLNLRTIYGLDGAHHMNIVIFLAASLFYLASPGSFAAKTCILFVGLQAVGSYLASGIAKARGASWRSGDAIRGVMKTRIYGHDGLGRWLDLRPGLSKALCWGTIVFECSFILAFIAEPELLTALLLGGALFHASAAFFMGLNGFFFAFVATYPAIVYLNRYVAISLP